MNGNIIDPIPESLTPDEYDFIMAFRELPKEEQEQVIQKMKKITEDRLL